MATTAEQKPTLEQVLTQIIEAHNLDYASIAASRRDDGTVYFYCYAQSVEADGERLCGTTGKDGLPISQALAAAISDLNAERYGVKPVELPAIEVKPTIDQWNYKGWAISYDMTPIPDRSFDWTATSPDFDVDCDQDGFHRCGGEQVHAATYEALLEEIECAIAEQAEVVS